VSAYPSSERLPAFLSDIDPALLSDTVVCCLYFEKHVRVAMGPHFFVVLRVTANLPYNLPQRPVHVILGLV
jgi:hypothetical protein